MPCERCGASLLRAAADQHVCNPERKADFEALREALAFESEFADWLGTPGGKFAQWLALGGRGQVGPLLAILLSLSFWALLIGTLWWLL